MAADTLLLSLPTAASACGPYGPGSDVAWALVTLSYDVRQAARDGRLTPHENALMERRLAALAQEEDRVAAAGFRKGDLAALDRRIAAARHLLKRLIPTTTAAR